MSWPLFLSDSNAVDASLSGFIQKRIHEVAVIEERELFSKNVTPSPLATLALPAFQSPVYRSMLMMISSQQSDIVSSHSRLKTGSIRTTWAGSLSLADNENARKTSLLRCTVKDVRRSASVAIGLLVKELPLRKWFVVGTTLSSNDYSERFQSSLNPSSKFPTKSQNQKVSA